MSKSVKTALAVAVVLIVTGAMLIAGALLGGVRIQDLWNNGNFGLSMISTGYGNLKGYTVCSSGEESFSPAEVKRLDLGWISGSVRIETGGERVTLKESCAQPLKEDQKLCWKLENGTLSVRFCKAVQTRLTGKDLVVLVPAGWTAESATVDATSADLTLRALRVEGPLTLGATSGDVLCENCRCGDLDAGSTSGSVELRGVDCSRLTLGATSGMLSAEDCRCDSLEAGTTSGRIRLCCDAKSITVTSTSGDIRCEGVPAGCGVECGATSGTVKLSLSGSADGQRIRIDTTSGDVYLDVPGAIDLDYDTASGDLRGHLAQGGSGCPSVEVDTTSGDLILGAFD